MCGGCGGRSIGAAVSSSFITTTQRGNKDTKACILFRKRSNGHPNGSDVKWEHWKLLKCLWDE